MAKVKDCIQSYLEGAGITCTIHRTELIEPLIDVLSGITVRYMRSYQSPQQLLNDVFLQLKSGHRSQNAFVTDWSEIAREIVTSPHWVEFLFPHVCKQKPDVIALVRRLNGRQFSPPADIAFMNKAYDGKRKINDTLPP